MGLPAGLLPKEVKSYKLSGSGLLEVFLDGPCLTRFDTMALYESEVRANLTYGSLTGVEGLSQEELFLWLPVKDIIVNDPSSGLILFDIGVAHKQLSLSLFEDPPDCAAKSVLKDYAGNGKAFAVAA
ncbi:serine protease [Perilla frutescens var. hirtella]|nr:serine protease [Perilla frutescens var. hirtella]